MFFFRHPRPVVDGRAVAVQVVQQKAMKRQTAMLVVDPAPPAPPAPPARVGQAASSGEQAATDTQ